MSMMKMARSPRPRGRAGLVARQLGPQIFDSRAESSPYKAYYTCPLTSRPLHFSPYYPVQRPYPAFVARSVGHLFDKRRDGRVSSKDVQYDLSQHAKPASLQRERLKKHAGEQEQFTGRSFEENSEAEFVSIENEK